MVRFEKVTKWLVAGIEQQIFACRKISQIWHESALEYFLLYSMWKKCSPHSLVSGTIWILKFDNFKGNDHFLHQFDQQNRPSKEKTRTLIVYDRCWFAKTWIFIAANITYTGWPWIALLNTVLGQKSLWFFLKKNPFHAEIYVLFGTFNALFWVTAHNTPCQKHPNLDSQNTPGCYGPQNTPVYFAGEEKKEKWDVLGCKKIRVFWKWGVFGCIPFLYSAISPAHNFGQSCHLQSPFCEMFSEIFPLLSAVCQSLRSLSVCFLLPF